MARGHGVHSAFEDSITLSCLAATAMILPTTDDLVPRIKAWGVSVDSFLAFEIDGHGASWRSPGLRAIACHQPARL
jgi:hypothetical protein